MTDLLLLALFTFLQTAPVTETRPATLAGDVAKLAASTTNEERFDVLTAMLAARKIAYAIEPFTIDKPLGREPRTAGRNVVVALGESEGGIVIGAHYDAARLADGSLSKGAVDNAASTVVLVRLAEALRADKLPVPVRIVWFDMEELGLVGSAQYVKAHSFDRITAMLNFDINAYGTTIVFGPSGRKDNATLRRALGQTCAVEDIDCIGFTQMPPGDDRSFVRAGIPAISIAILPAIEAHQLWLMMNAGANAGLAQGTSPAILRTIHTPEDTPDKVNEEAMNVMLRFAVSLVKDLGGSR
jgi:hypothetical protein